MTSTMIVARSARADVLHYFKLGLLAAALASAVNLTIYALSKALFNLPFLVPMQSGTEPNPLPVFMVILMSAVPGVLAAGVLFGLNRFTRRGLLVFQVVAVVLALLSLAGPLSLPIDGGTSAALASMHLGAAVAIVGVLTAGAARQQQREVPER